MLQLVPPIDPLERLFESPAKIEQRLREQQADVRVKSQDADGDPPTFRCRVCDLEAAEPSYCPSCLADTMVRMRRPAGLPPSPGSSD
jgi:rubrerythrin